MGDNRVTALNPTVRRALGRPSADHAAAAPPPSPAEASTAEVCPECHDIGLVPAAGGEFAMFTACPRCRTGELRIFVTEISAERWIAVRDLPGSWGTGGCAVEAFLGLERRTPDSASVFAPRYICGAAAAPDRRQRVLERRDQVA